ncbi:MAG: hypothetical protein JRI97_04555 [Deltaproteobacteria bacterium]|nr:hypothetical protein [Deltaproteobacteria bacterium]
MDLRSRIQTLFKEAEIYRQQGLYDEAIKKYHTVKGLVDTNQNIKNRDQLLTAITKKIQVMERAAEEEERALPSPDAVSSNVQDLVKGFFSSGKGQKGASAFKGAIALAQLRQFERALIEFSKLLENKQLRVPAAKNVLKCHLAMGNIDAAVAQYGKWVEDGNGFPYEDVEGIRTYFQELLKKKGHEVELPAREAPPQEEASGMPTIELEENGAAAPAPAEEKVSAPTGLMKPKSELDAIAKAEETLDDEPIEICSMEITLEEGPAEGQSLELDVVNQRGSRINLIIPASEKAFYDSLKVGQKLNDVQYFSHFVMFRGTGTVLDKSPITTGGNKGAFSLDVKMDPQ